MQFTDNIHEVVAQHIVAGETDWALEESGRSESFPMNAAVKEVLSSPHLTIEGLSFAYIRSERQKEGLRNDAEASRNRYWQLQKSVDADTETLSEAVWLLAESLGMTAQKFDRWVDEINDELENGLKKRVRKWSVTLKYEVTIQKTIEVEAASEEEAREIAPDGWDVEDVLDAIHDEFDLGVVSVEDIEEVE